jgi:CubicO group peptidase (beta-lactamase class C family)
MALGLVLCAPVSVVPSLFAQTGAAGPGGIVRPADARRLRDTVGTVLDAGVRDSAFPGAIAVIGTRDSILLERPAGHLDWAPSPPPNDSTLWDMASLTKVIATTTAVMQLYERGLIDLDAPVQQYIPEFRGPMKDRVTVRMLLTHSSGLPADPPHYLYQEASTRDSMLALLYATPLDTTPGTRMVYSDVGAILLGQIVVRLSGEALDRYVDRHVVRPLRLHETMFRPPRALWPRTAPTEIDTVYRHRQMRGEVHDENAYALGGVAGHAGLFSSGRDLARFARMYLNGGVLDGVRIVQPETIASFTKLQDSTLSNRALGWEKPTGTNSAGHLLSPRAFGHTGFTGTSIWIDPANDLFIILLTNRVDPTRARHGIYAVRVQLADAVVGVLARRPGAGAGAP